ncbi:ABC transporter substrate-binding protein [Oceanobacillus salinisoli]|uniref:ABC transporter substrate-binding protein n=1 Tax=Oceanobacillus salinisoli TaxID=2678611 RepID=UPI0018CC52CA|nr:ABC transporter substrate-binding protein [Oceanobacillus salinisoli]
MKHFKITLFVAMLVVFLVACGGEEETGSEPNESSSNPTGDEETGDSSEMNSEKTELNMALSVDPDGLDPHRTTAASTFQITNNIYDTLVKVTPDGEFEEGLAESWETSDDGLTITFTLRDGVVFHNGREMTAEDVKYSFERLKGEESPRAGDFANIVEINVIDEKTVEFVTEELNVALLSNFAYPWTAIVPEEASNDLRNNPVGTGPFKLEEWIPQQHLVLVKNEDYYDPAHLEKVTFKMMPDATSQVSALQAGELDVIGLTGDLVGQFEGNDQFTILENQANSIQLMAMNLENEALSDVRVRQAIDLAVDKQALIEAVWWGYGEEIGSHYPPILKEYVDTNDTITYDPERAKELLAEAGYAEGLELDMYLPASYQAYVDAGQVIADELSKVGITANIEIVEWATWLSDVYTNRQYDLTVVGHTGRLDPYVLLSRYHTESGENYFNYSNERVDEILTLVQKERDEDVRVALYQEMQEILAEEVPALYIQSPTILMVTASDVAGFKTYPIDIYEMKDVYFTN